MGRQSTYKMGRHIEHPKMEALKLALHIIQFWNVQGHGALSFRPSAASVGMQVKKDLDEMSINPIHKVVMRWQNIN